MTLTKYVYSLIKMYNNFKNVHGKYISIRKNFQNACTLKSLQLYYRYIVYHYKSYYSLRG